MDLRSTERTTIQDMNPAIAVGQLIRLTAITGVIAVVCREINMQRLPDYDPFYKCGSPEFQEELEDENGDIHIVCGCTRCQTQRKKAYLEEYGGDDENDAA